MGIAKEDGNLEASEQRIDSYVPSLLEGELPVTTFPANICTPEETPGVRRSFKIPNQASVRQ